MAPQNLTLSPLQTKVLKALAAMGQTWRLTGGGALILAYTHHRQTQDLDLFFKSGTLERIPHIARSTLESAGMKVSVIQDAISFARLQVSDNHDRVIVDLVADPVEVIESPVHWNCEGVDILLDTQHEILVNKLCTLLSRAELRDLIDVQALIENGGNLDLAIKQAIQKDSGFSALTLAWVLEHFPVKRLGEALKLPKGQIDSADSFRKELIKRLTA